MNKLTVSSAQVALAKVYGRVNANRHSIEDLLDHSEGYMVTGLNHYLNGENISVWGPHFAIWFAWTIAIANRFNVPIDLQTEIYRRFPDKCPYCGSKPCLGPGRCKTIKGQQRLVFPESEFPDFDIRGVQYMFDGIYPPQRTGNINDDLMKAIHRLWGEYSELRLALIRSRNSEGAVTVSTAFIGEELVDIFARTMAVFNILRFDLMRAFELTFDGGLVCCSCREPVCTRCQLTIITSTGPVAVW